MAGNISVGSYDDLGPDHEQPIDRNPKLDCQICGETFPWQDYWKDRILGGDGDPRDADLWCDDCREEIEAQRRRRSQNARLSEWGDR